MAVQREARSALLEEALGPGGPIVVFDKVTLAFDEKVILDEISFTLKTGHTKIFLGASGAGKSTILRLILGLLKPDGGHIFVNGDRIDDMTEDQMMVVRADLGMVFQEGALFDSLTVRENVGYKLVEQKVPPEQVNRRVEEVLGFVRLGEFVDRKPSELSGGQRRRVAIARAMAAKPRILLYDEPTTGLDPITSITIDEEIIKLRDIEEVSSIVVTHQLRDAFFVAEHMAVKDGASGVKIERAPASKADEAEFIMLREGRIAFEGNASELREVQRRNPYIEAFLS
ncbi:MAG: ATP-binding cassette domain-containing protein [Acidobacteriota bacterium]|nr:ATP-binding cassette domain-containing protein [Acidobacteriota bacterium]MDQ3418773.1 ATP-binding cassette domain-containing protein [Acidobacteriota bacterium]